MAKAEARRKVVAMLSADPEPLSRVDLREVQALARRIRKALCADVTEYAEGDDTRNLTRFIAVVEALAGVLEIELRMGDFIAQLNQPTQRGTQL